MINLTLFTNLGKIWFWCVSSKGVILNNDEKETVSLSAPLLVPAAEDVCPEHPFLWLVVTLKRNNSFLKHLGGN